MTRGLAPRLVAVMLTTTFLASSCSTSAVRTAQQHTPARRTHAAPVALPRPAHVVVVVFENKSASQVIGNRGAPYLTRLARHGANYVHAHGVAHPSEPNYLALFSGSTHGVTSDACPLHLGREHNLARQLDGSGRSFVGYAEGLPHRGYLGCSSGKYARKHAPWADFTGLPRGTARPYRAFPRALHKLPTVAFVVPNLCHDMHDCAVSAGDRWARRHLRRYVAWARIHNSLLIVTFDEDDGTTANHIATLLVGPMVRAGRYRQIINHYNVLRTIEDFYRLRPLGLARQVAALRCWRR